MSKGKKAKGLLMVIVGLMFGLISGIYFAFVLSKLWTMFMVPAFNLPAISMKTAYGISLIFSMLRGYQSTTSKNDESPKILATFIVALISYSMAWLIGSIVAGL